MPRIPARWLPLQAAALATLVALALPLAWGGGTYPRGFYFRETLLASLSLLAAGAAAAHAPARGARLAMAAGLVLAAFFLGEAIGFDDGMAYAGFPSATRYADAASWNPVAAGVLVLAMGVVAWRLAPDADA